MTTSTTNRYQDLLSLSPYRRKSFEGDVLPYKDRAHEFEFTSNKTSTLFNVYFNDIKAKDITTDSLGYAVIRSTPRLAPGDYEVKVVDPADETATVFFISVKNLATWIAAYAEVIERLDVAADDIKNAFSIETVGSGYIEDRYGRAVRQPRPATYLLEEYRRMLMQLRPAYRHFGGQPYGLRQAVESFTSVSPLVIPAAWRPRWLLGADAGLGSKSNLDLLTRTRLAPQQYAAGGASTDLPNLNRQALVYVHPSVGASAVTEFRDPPTAQKLSVTFSASSSQVTLIGLDELGEVITEVVPDPSISGLAATYNTQLIYSALTSAQRTAGSGTATIGLTVERFVTIDRVGDFNRPSVAVNLGCVGYTGDTYQEFAWGGGPNYRVIDGSTTTLRDVWRRGRVIGTVDSATYDLDPIGGASVLTYHDRIGLEADNLGVVLVDVGPGGAGAGTVTQANAVSRINTAFTDDLRYGATYSTIASLITGSEGMGTSVIQLRGQGMEPVKIHPVPCDAGQNVFGLPTLQTRLSSVGSGTSLVCAAGSTATFPVGRSFDVRVRGLRRAPTTGTLTSNGSNPGKTMRLSASGYTFTQGDVGGYIRWSDTDGNTGNNGLHRIVALGPVAGTCIIIHETANTSTGTFTLAGGVPDSDGALAIYHPGVIYTVTANNTATATLTTSTSVYAWPIGAIVEAADSVPYTARGSVGLGEIDITTDPTYRPNHDFGDSLSVAGTTVTLTCSRGLFTGLTGADITLSGCENLENNGTFELTGVSGNTCTFENSEALDETSEFEWSIELVSEVDTVTPSGTTMPDGWRVLSASTTVYDNNNHATAITTAGGQLSAAPIVLKASTNIQVSRVVDTALDYTGLELDVEFWLQEHSADGTEYLIEVSFDGTDYHEVASTSATFATPLVAIETNTQFIGPRSPFRLSGSFFVPHDATTVILRLTRTPLVVASGTMTIERCTLTCPTSTGLYTGVNSVVRSARRSKFGDLLYVWTAETLTDEEKEFLGLATEDAGDDVFTGADEDDVDAGRPFSIPATFGHIDYVSNANGYIDRVDVSEIDDDQVVPIRANLAGIYDSTDWLATETVDGRMENLQVFVGTPSRASHAIPITISAVVGEALTMVEGGGNAVATLTVESNHDGEQPAATYPQPPNTDNGTNARLYEVRSTDSSFFTADGLVTVIPAGTLIPVPDSEDADSIQPWEFTAADEIRINDPYYDATSTYVIDYDVLTRATTEPFQLETTGVDIEDYVWLADLSEYRRHQVDEANAEREEELIFRANFTARLTQRARIESGATLLRDNGVVQESVSQGRWSFVDSKNVRIDPNIFDVDSIYTLTYTAKVPSIATTVSLKFEWRQAETSGGLASEDWVEIENGQVLSPTFGAVGVANVGDNTVLPWHQMRVTATGIKDLRDFRLYGFGIKGVHLYGATASAPGLLVNE